MPTQRSRQPKSPGPALPSEADSAQLRSSLATWYAANRRPLPWREQPSAYRTVVSEFMLQQTQVRTALPYFDNWMRRFPDFAALAAADEEDVLKSWAGLGYYARARRLHSLARDIHAAGGSLPTTAEGWSRFTGIGPYTAAAVASIAFGHPAACVDGNVVRILARLTGDSAELGAGSLAAARFQPLADALLDRTRPGDHNQAMMELGATICTRAAPACTICPWIGHCAAARTGRQAELPRISRKAVIERELPRAWIECGGSLLVQNCRSDGRLAGLLELPEWDPLFPDRPPVAADCIGTVRRSITTTRYREPVYRSQPPQPLPATVEWLPLDALWSRAWSGPHRAWVAARLSGS